MVVSEKYKIGDIIQVMHVGQPEKMKIIAFDNGMFQCQFLNAFGISWYTEEQLNQHKARLQEFEKPIKVTEDWADKYTDANGMCFSDADPGF